MINKAIQEKIERLQRGETFWTSESGNSMTPILYSNQKTKLEPVKDWHDLKKDDVVFCKVHSSCVTHKVYAVDNNKGVLIGNNHGHLNGWTKTVYGKMIEKG